MSTPVKMALAALGSGVVAVGGHEIYSASTGKNGLFFSQKNKNLSNKEKIQELLKGWEGKCVLKIRTGTETTNKEWETVKDKESLEKLLTALTTFNENNCQEQTDQERMVIFKNKGTEWSEITSDISNEFHNAFLKKYFLGEGEDIVFTINNDKTGDIDKNYLIFSSEDNETKKIEVGFSVLNNDSTFVGGNAYTTMKTLKNELIQLFSNWKCVIKFEKTETNLTQLENIEQLIETNSPYGFFNKLRIDTNSAIKKKFIQNCSGGEKTIHKDGKTLVLSKTFKLQEDTQKNKLIFSNQSEFDVWFKENE